MKTLLFAQSHSIQYILSRFDVVRFFGPTSLKEMKVLSSRRKFEKFQRPSRKREERPVYTEIVDVFNVLLPESNGVSKDTPHVHQLDISFKPDD